MLLPTIAQFIKTFHGKGAHFVLYIYVGNIPDDTTGQSRLHPVPDTCLIHYYQQHSRTQNDYGRSLSKADNAVLLDEWQHTATITSIRLESRGDIQIRQQWPATSKLSWFWGQALPGTGTELCETQARNACLTHPTASPSLQQPTGLFASWSWRSARGRGAIID